MKSKIQIIPILPNKSQFQNPKNIILNLGFWIYLGFGSIWVWYYYHLVFGFRYSDFGFYHYISLFRVEDKTSMRRESSSRIRIQFL